jgi:serine kinase of HPr protein (carbohydrate metabolism regulator)
MSGPVHGSALLVGERGVLIRGPSGSGKSALLLALLDRHPGASWLIADDRVILTSSRGRLVASVPATIAGRMEIRGQGIVSREHVSPALIGLVVDLKRLGECPRLPSPEEAIATLEGVALPRLILPIGSYDGTLRVAAAIARLGQGRA